MTQKVGALFGYGRAGKIHMKTFQNRPDILIKYVVDELVESVQTEIPNATVLHPKDEDIIFNDASVDFCVICSPTFTHEHLITKALKTKKHVFVEKPIAEDFEKTQACYTLAAQQNIVLHCSFNRRYDPSLITLREQIQSGSIGKVLCMLVTSRDHPFPQMGYLQTSGGIFHDCAVHDLDLSYFMLNEWPQTVYAVGNCHNSDLAAINDHDTAIITLTYASGVVVSINLSRLSTYGYDQRVEILGEHGTIMSENIRSNTITLMNKQGVHLPPYQYSFPQRYADSYINSFDCFISAIKGKSTSAIVRADETLNVTLLAIACEESIKTGKPVTFSPVQP